jgi:hypothetical protein
MSHARPSEWWMQNFEAVLRSWAAFVHAQGETGEQGPAKAAFLEYMLQSWAAFVRQQSETVGEVEGEMAETPANESAAPDDSQSSEPQAGPPAHWLERIGPAGPPAHWLQYIQEKAPHLLDQEDLPTFSAEPIESGPEDLLPPDAASVETKVPLARSIHAGTTRAASGDMSAPDMDSPGIVPSPTRAADQTAAVTSPMTAATDMQEEPSRTPGLRPARRRQSSHRAVRPEADMPAGPEPEPREADPGERQREPSHVTRSQAAVSSRPATSRLRPAILPPAGRQAGPPLTQPIPPPSDARKLRPASPVTEQPAPARSQAPGFRPPGQAEIGPSAPAGPPHSGRPAVLRRTAIQEPEPAGRGRNAPTMSTPGTASHAPPGAKPRPAIGWEDPAGGKTQARKDAVSGPPPLARQEPGTSVQPSDGQRWLAVHPAPSADSPHNTQKVRDRPEQLTTTAIHVSCWPELPPEEPLVDDEEWHHPLSGRLRQVQERRQRLDREQRGTQWNV